MHHRPNDFQTHGLFSHLWTGSANPMPTFHRHNEIELNLLTAGEMTYTIAGHAMQIPARALCVFWAGFSHRVEMWKGEEIWSLAIPLTEFLTWPLPQEGFVHALLQGELLYEVDPISWEHDLHLMKLWKSDLATQPRPEQQEVVLLEVQARLRRMSAKLGRGASLHPKGVEPSRVARMLQFIAHNYDEDLTVADVAKAADTNASYAMELFKLSCGMSIMQYVNDQRVAHARRMLATTDSKILDVAMEAGFGSVSQFYNVFQKVCGQTPREYARANIGRNRSIAEAK